MFLHLVVVAVRLQHEEHLRIWCRFKLPDCRHTAMDKPNLLSVMPFYPKPLSNFKIASLYRTDTLPANVGSFRSPTASIDRATSQPCLSSLSLTMNTYFAVEERLLARIAVRIPAQ